MKPGNVRAKVSSIVVATSCEEDDAHDRNDGSVGVECSWTGCSPRRESSSALKSPPHLFDVPPPRTSPTQSSIEIRCLAHTTEPPFTWRSTGGHLLWS